MTLAGGSAGSSHCSARSIATRDVGRAGNRQFIVARPVLALREGPVNLKKCIRLCVDVAGKVIRRRA